MIEKEYITNKLFVNWAIIVVTLIIIATIAIYFVFGKWENGGTFGDSFGAVNALFSGLAFAGIIFTIYLQRNELSLQRKELELTREELKGQKVEFEKQNETLRRQHKTLVHQQFETTFFNLLNNHNKIREHIEYYGLNKVLYKGYEFFNHGKLLLTDYYSESVANHEERPKEAYRLLINKRQFPLDHYFRSLHQLLNYLLLNEGYEISELKLSQTDLDNASMYALQLTIEEDFKNYANYIQSQMTTSELFLLFYHSLFYPELKALIYHYRFLESLKREDLLNPFFDVGFYSGETLIAGDVRRKYSKLVFQSRNDIFKE